jgi:hypothetical protein
VVEHTTLPGTPPAALLPTQCQCRRGVKCATKGCPCRASGQRCGPACGCSKECCENHAAVEVQDQTIVLSPLSPLSSYTAPSIFPAVTSPSRTPTPPPTSQIRAIDPALLAAAFRVVLVRLDDKPTLIRMCSEWGISVPTSLGVSQLVDRLHRHTTTQADLLRLSEDSLLALSDAAGIHLPSADMMSLQLAHKLHVHLSQVARKLTPYVDVHSIETKQIMGQQNTKRRDEDSEFEYVIL